MILLLIIAIIIGNKAFFALAFFLNIMSLYEYINVIDDNGKNLDLSKIIYILSGTLLLIFSLVNFNLVIPSIPIIIIIISMINILDKKFDADTTIYSIFGLIYISLILSFMVLMLSKMNNAEGLALIIFAEVITIATDSAAYLFGIKFGKHKLCPKISPKKSIEGSIAGLVFGILSGIILHFIFINYNIIDISLIDCIIMATINSILSQFGDLTASMVKRKFDVKDYGWIIPGHGGVLDRIDGTLFSLAGTFFYVYIVLNMFTF